MNGTGMPFNARSKTPRRRTAKTTGNVKLFCRREVKDTGGKIRESVVPLKRKL